VLRESNERARSAVNLFQIATLDDPYPAYAQLREAGPLHHGEDGMWYVTRYADVRALLRDKRLVAGTGVASSFGLSEGPVYDAMTAWLMALDGAAHGRARRLASSAFGPTAVQAMRPDILAIVDSALEAMDASVDGEGWAEFVSTVASTVPLQVMRLLFGVDQQEWDHAITRTLTTAGSPIALMQSLLEYLSGLVSRRRGAPGSDMFSAMFHSGEGGDRLTDAELVANGLLLITAGIETTMSLIGNAMVVVFSRPEVVQRLRRDPPLIANAVEEVLRFETPALTTSRTATEEIRVGDGQIPRDADVLFALAAANRDPRQYTEPDQFDLGRTDIHPLSFGGGGHACLGAGLARLETQLVLSRVLERHPTLEVDVVAVTWRKDSPTVRGPAMMPVRLNGLGREGDAALQ
jgi:cytochrome P450